MSLLPTVSSTISCFFVFNEAGSLSHSSLLPVQISSGPALFIHTVPSSVLLFQSNPPLRGSNEGTYMPDLGNMSVAQVYELLVERRNECRCWKVIEKQTRFVQDCEHGPLHPPLSSFSVKQDDVSQIDKKRQHYISQVKRVPASPNPHKLFAVMVLLTSFGFKRPPRRHRLKRDWKRDRK